MGDSLIRSNGEMYCSCEGTNFWPGALSPSSICAIHYPWDYLRWLKACDRDSEIPEACRILMKYSFSLPKRTLLERVKAWFVSIIC